MNKHIRDHLLPSEGESNQSPLRHAWQTRGQQVDEQRLLDNDAQYFLRQSLSTPCLSGINKAEGIWIEDKSGRRYMDFHGNSVHHIGYGHPKLIEAIKRQIDDLSFSPRRFTNEPAVLLAEKLAAISPGSLGKSLFTTGGSDAIEVALKLARAATGRFKTISFWDSFHGAGFGAAGIGGEQTFRSGSIGPLLPGTEHVAPYRCYRCPYGYQDINGGPDLDSCKMTCANFVRYVLEKEGDVAAVIAEPVRSVPYIPPPGFWKSVRQACNDHGALLIFDEIPNGLGKTGKMFACDHDDVAPDILVIGKALGGGILPIAAAIARPELDVAQDAAFGHYTHEKNPVTARAALTTIEIIEEEGLVENAQQVGAYALERLKDLKDKHANIGDVRGLGFVLGIELVHDHKEKIPAEDIAEKVLYAALERGLSFKVSMGNVLNLSPPLITSRDDMDIAMRILDDCLSLSSTA
jgi:4-aminobutyrate aminotransferase